MTKEQMLLKHISSRLAASGAEIGAHVRATTPNQDTVTALHALHDEVLGLANLIVFLTAGMEYEIWKAAQE
jgi:hypothetical protein